MDDDWKEPYPDDIKAGWPDDPEYIRVDDPDEWIINQRKAASRLGPVDESMFPDEAQDLLGRAEENMKENIQLLSPFESDTDV